MAERFDCFVVFAEMRTGSNFLETNLNALDGVHCHGEAFNPAFIGYPNKTDLLGISRATRDSEPAILLRRLRDAEGLNGFRYFHDHDPRILDAILDDRRCAKIVLLRNPLESYVSLQIARETGQWKLTDVKRRKAAKATFDTGEFVEHVEALQAFQVLLLNRLQVSGQTPFYVAYEDLQDVGVMNGLADWLGVPARLDELNKSLKPQNPGALADKVSNPDAMAEALSRLDMFNLSRTPNFEPRRGPSVPSFVFGDKLPLIYMPMRGGPEDSVTEWMAGSEGCEPGDLATKLNQKQLRQWKRARPGHRSFTVLRHPAARAHHVFCSRFLTTGPGSFLQIREAMRKQFKVPLPDGDPGPGWTLQDHRAAFEGFLRFVKANLNGQTAIRVDANWATQAQCLAGFAELVTPDFVFREEELATDLPALAARVGSPASSKPASAPPDTPFDLADIHDDALEAAVFDVYQRDYVFFGFDAWRQAA